MAQQAAQLYRTLTGSSQKSQTGTDGTAPALSRLTTTNTQTGVLNHLTEAQQIKLEQFKQQLQNDGWWSSDGINGKPTHDDGTLLRYLRARKFDVQGAYGQFTDTEKWLKEQHVEDLYEHFDVDFFERARTMYPQWTGQRDRRGIPIYVYEIKNLDSKAIDRYQKESTEYKKNSPNHKNLSTQPKLLPLFALYHNLLNFILPLCSSLERPRPEVPITNSTNIVDISGVSLRQFWNLKAHMQDASVLATAHYPETLDRIFIIGAPSFFPTVWGWVKRWFDPVTVSKIFILGRYEVQPTLEQFMDPECIPKKYGGRLNWQWGDVPALDDETRQALERDGNKGWVKGPALWLNSERIVVGSDHGKLRRSEKEIAEKKPIVYAADYTEEPVHPEKRASVVSGHKQSLSIHRRDEQVRRHSPDSPSTLVEDKHISADGPRAVMAAGAGPETAAAATISHPPPIREETINPAIPKQQTPNVPTESVRTSPMGDAQVHIPNAQPAAPATTVEYISSTSSRTPEDVKPAPPPTNSADIAGPVRSEPISTTASTTASTAVGSATSSTVYSSVTAEPAAHPAGHTQPGPLSSHQAAVNRKIASQLSGESTVIIPAEANGPLPHPAIVVASDAKKGLALEEDKLVLSNKDPNHPTRPQPERFVTALEF